MIPKVGLILTLLLGLGLFIDDINGLTKLI